MRRSFVVLAMLALAAPVAAQEELDVSKIRHGSAPCTLLTGAGSPEGVVTGRVCDAYLRTDGNSATTILYLKTASGTTGWLAPGGVTGTGTVDYLPKWTATTTLGNSVIYESGNNLGLGTTTTTYKITAGGTTAPATGYVYDLGAYLKKWLTIHAAELRVETLVAADTMATIGGRIVVAPTTQLTSDLAAAATTMYVKHNDLANGDRVRLEANGQVEFIAVTSSAGGGGPYSYTITRDLDGSGANDWVAGDAVLNTGTTGDGYIDLYSDHSLRGATQYGPTIVGNVRTGTTYSDLEERWAVGNLDGLFGYSGTTYGAAFGSPSAAWLKIDPTNGVRLGFGSGGSEVTKVQIEADGDATFSGAITAASGSIGGWTIGASDLKAQTGTVGMSSGASYSFWAGDATPANAEFRVTPAGAMTASNATISGSITATSGTFGGWTLGASSLTGGDATLASSGNLTLGTGNNVVRLSADDGTYRLWAGNATAGSASFRVSTAGALTASGASLSGSLSAANGAVTIDSNGINIDNGNSGYNQIKWSDGTVFGSSGDIAAIEVDNSLFIYSGNGAVALGSGMLYPTNSGYYDLGGNSYRWRDVWVDHDIHHFNDYYWDSPPTTTANDYPIVWSPSIKALYQKTDGSNATGCTSIDAEAGIVTGCSDPITGQLQALQNEVADLRSQLADLRALVTQLLTGGKQ